MACGDVYERGGTLCPIQGGGGGGPINKCGGGGGGDRYMGGGGGGYCGTMFVCVC